MPELPEVEVTLQGIRPHIEKQTIKSVVVKTNKLRYPVPQNLNKILVNQQLTSIHRRGKYLIFTFNKDKLLIHLGMSGSLRITEKKTVWRKHDHWHWQFDSVGIRYHDPRRFGSLTWFNDQHAKNINRMGIEPLDAAFTAPFLYDFSKKSTRTIKSLIMDQKVVVGVGNIYANEALFLSGIHPSQPANTINIEVCERLSANIRHILCKAIELGGSTLKDFINPDGKHGYFSQTLYVYGKAGQACINCKTIIETVTITNRSSFFCPKCQFLEI